VFVLGCWRSGTTWLHRLLCQDERLAYPTTLQVLNPHTFAFLQGRLSGRRARWGNRLYHLWARLNWGSRMVRWRRPSDAMPAGTEFPGEDEFAMLMLGRSDLISHLVGSDLARHYNRYLNLQSLTPAELEDWKAHWLNFLQKLTLECGWRPLVLKSPNHTARVASLLRIFPQARFVHIHRQPLEVYRSFSRHLAILGRSGDLLEARSQQPEETCLQLYSQLYQAYLKDRPGIPSGQLHELGYHDLQRDPLGQLQQMYQALSLPDFKVVRPKIQAYLGEIQDYSPTPLPELEPDQQERIRWQWREFFQAFGYA